VPLYIGVAKGPYVGCQLVETCCCWCLIAMEAVVAAADAVKVKALTSKVLPLASEGHL
jgi:hypothetical protein